MGKVVDFPDVVFGIVTPTSTGADGATRSAFRDITLGWSRHSYCGRVLESASVDGALRAAAESGARHCVCQRAGHVLVDTFHVRTTGIVEDLVRLVRDHDVAVAGHVVDAGRAGRGVALSDRFLLVDLEHFERLGFPSFGPVSDGAVGRSAQLGSGIGGGELVASCLKARLPVVNLDPMVVGRTLDLEGPTASEDAFLRLRGQPIPADAQLTELTRDQRAFLGRIRDQAAFARQGVFLWNFEPYADAVVASQSFPGPIHALYSVASGFKPNMLLHLHGFTPATRVVFFDYSPAALAVRRWLVENWDGRDFPALVPALSKAFPPSEMYYQVPGGEADTALSQVAVEAAWHHELERWGGAAIFHEHWERYRSLSHEYVDCDLLDDPGPLLRRVNGDHGVIWWSNAFFTVYGNWFHLPAHRRERFEHFIASFAAAAPDLLLYGSDDNNSCINCITAADYDDRYFAAHVSDVRPFAAGRVHIIT